MSILERFRTWRMRRRIKKVYLLELSTYSGIPIDKLTGTELGMREVEDGH